MHHQGLASAKELLSFEIRWGLACLGGNAEDRLVADELRSDLDHRIAATSDDVPIPLLCLLRNLGLSMPAYHGLVLLACSELDRTLGGLVQSQATRDCPDHNVLGWRRAVAGLGGREVEELHEHGLIALPADTQRPLHRRQVRATDRVLELADGDLRLDPAIAAFADLQIVDELSVRRGAGRNVKANRVGGLIVCAGAATADRTHQVRVAGGASSALVVRCRELPELGAQLRDLLRAVVREARLMKVTLVFEDLDVLLFDRTDGRHAFDAVVVGRAPEPILATSSAERTCSIRDLRTTVLAATMPTAAERTAAWRRYLPRADESAREAAGRYVLSESAIQATAEAVEALADGASITCAEIHHGVRGHLEHSLGSVATRIETSQTWNDLVLPAEQFDQLIELVARVRHKHLVLDRWGFGAKIGKSHGLCALMSGPPGTGKTMAAGLIAKELGLDLYQVDLSRIMSKYIGETEKQLAAVFDAAESGHAVILFDEADSIFGKRTEVKSSNDRYANLEVNFLLQRMESFNGISLLTTNHETSIDEAFKRRLAFHLRFSLPDEQQRALIWKAMIPPDAEVEPDLELADLGRDFEMTGGYIKNAVVRAAFMAAHDGSPISRAHLQRAAHAEYEAIGKLAFRPQAAAGL
ncbi:MAG: ATP-binding protein [Myxococcales bacterium]|nr:ATP-binding protein [Myxococcales bacterium]